MGTKRGAGRSSFVGSVLDLVDAFYESVVQVIKPWAAPPPKLRPKPQAASETAVQHEAVAPSSRDVTAPHAVAPSGAGEVPHPATEPEAAPTGTPDVGAASSEASKR
jgi:hypothetical protein